MQNPKFWRISDIFDGYCMPNNEIEPEFGNRSPDSKESVVDFPAHCGLTNKISQRDRMRESDQKLPPYHQIPTLSNLNTLDTWDILQIGLTFLSIFCTYVA